MLYETLLAFDFGLSYIGVATGQAITHTATPLTTLRAHEGEPNWKQIDALIHDWRPDAIIVGIPLNMDGSEQSITEHARQFIELLKKRYHLPVLGMDERLSTKEAKHLLFSQQGYKALSRNAINATSAQIILESWFHTHHEK